MQLIIQMSRVHFPNPVLWCFVYLHGLVNEVVGICYSSFYYVLTLSLASRALESLIAFPFGYVELVDSET